MTHLLAEIFKCNEIQPQKSISDMAIAFHGQPPNNIDNVFSANSNYRVQYFNDACFLKVQKFQSVHNLFLIYFGSLSNVQKHKRRLPGPSRSSRTKNPNEMLLKGFC